MYNITKLLNYAKLPQFGLALSHPTSPPTALTQASLDAQIGIRHPPECPSARPGQALSDITHNSTNPIPPTALTHPPVRGGVHSRLGKRRSPVLACHMLVCMCRVCGSFLVSADPALPALPTNVARSSTEKENKLSINRCMFRTGQNV